jgi:hypothetical protein
MYFIAMKRDCISRKTKRLLMTSFNLSNIRMTLGIHILVPLRELIHIVITGIIMIHWKMLVLMLKECADIVINLTIIKISIMKIENELNNSSISIQLTTNK